MVLVMKMTGEKQKNFFGFLIKNNKFKRINYYDKTSTTDIISRIN